MINPNAITTMGLVLSEWMDKAKAEYRDLNIIYDEALTIETALTKIRAKREREEQPGKNEFPLLAFKRSALKFPEHGMGRRSQVTRLYHPKVSEEGKQQQGPTFYKTIYGKLDVPFIFCVESMHDEEMFEVEYMSEDRISSIKELNVEVPDLGIFNFYCQYSPVEEKMVQSKDVYYKVVQGTVSLLGWYIVLEGEGKIITEIHAKIKEFNNNVLVNIDIVS